MQAFDRRSATPDRGDVDKGVRQATDHGPRAALLPAFAACLGKQFGGFVPVRRSKLYGIGDQERAVHRATHSSDESGATA